MEISTVLADVCDVVLSTSGVVLEDVDVDVPAENESSVSGCR